VRCGEDVEIELFVELREFPLCGYGKELTGHGDKRAVVAGGMIDERSGELWSEEFRIAGAGEEVFETVPQLIGCGVLEASCGVSRRRSAPQGVHQLETRAPSDPRAPQKRD
jgi:hypothetical protein